MYTVTFSSNHAYQPSLVFSFFSFVVVTTAERTPKAVLKVQSGHTLGQPSHAHQPKLSKLNLKTGDKLQRKACMQAPSSQPLHNLKMLSATHGGLFTRHAAASVMVQSMQSRQAPKAGGKVVTCMESGAGLEPRVSVICPLT